MARGGRVNRGVDVGVHGVPHSAVSASCGDEDEKPQLGFWVREPRVPVPVCSAHPVASRSDPQCAWCAGMLAKLSILRADFSDEEVGPLTYACSWLNLEQRALAWLANSRQLDLETACDLRQQAKGVAALAQLACAQQGAALMYHHVGPAPEQLGAATDVH